MSVMNITNCADDNKNTGFGTCTLDFGAIVGAFIMSRDVAFTEAQLADLRDSLDDASVADKPNRIYPFHGFEAITDNTEDPTFQTMASGRQVFIKEGNYNWIMQFIDGGLCLSNKLRSFNNGNWAALFYDQKGNLFGYKTQNEVGADVIKGVPLDTLYTFPWKANDFSNVTQYRTQFSFKPSYVNEQIGFVQSDFPLSEVKGIKDVALTVTAPLTAGVVGVDAHVSCGGDDLHATYATELAVVGAWVAKNKSTGAEITVTTVVSNATGWTVTLDTVDTDYPTAGGQLTLSLASASVLAGLNVEGFEGIPLTLTV